MSLATDRFELGAQPAPHAWPEDALDILLGIMDSVSASSTVDGALNKLAATALRATGADRCAILTIDAAHPGQLVPAAAAARFGDRMSLERFRAMDPIDVSALGRDHELFDSAVIIEDVAPSRMIPDAWKQAWKSCSIAFVSLRAGSEWFGILAVDYVRERHEFTAGETRLLEAAASAAGVALRTAGLVQRFQQSVAVERRLSESIAALRRPGTLTETLSTVAEKVTSLLPGAVCTINLASADRKGFTPVAASGLAVENTEIRLAALPAEEIRAIQDHWRVDPHRPILATDLPSRDGWQAIIPPQISSGMLVPLVDNGDVLGFIAVGRASAPFTEDEVRVAQAFTEHAGLALAQARLTETLQFRLRLIEGLNKLSELVMQTSDLRVLLRALNRKFGTALGIRCSRVCLSNAHLAETLGVARPTQEERALLRSWRAQPAGDAHVVGHRVAVPVLIQNRPAGVLWVDSDLADGSRLGVVRAIAAGIGEVAYKAGLRRTAEERTRALAVAEDRQRIARDLHDTVGQTLYGIGLNLQHVIWENEDARLAKKLEDLRALASRGVTDVRSAVYALSFLQVRARGLLASLNTLVREFATATGISAHLQVSGRARALSDETESCLYRMAHESLVNVERHARATGVVLTLTFAEKDVSLGVRDDGVGLSLRTGDDWWSSAHFGLRSTARSFERAGGSFDVREAPPRGLQIDGKLPTAVR